jgi:hypothetical protein
MRYLLFSFLIACSGPSDTPSVSVKAVTPDQLVASDDALDDATITVDYEDGDGDIGQGTAEVHDCRADGVVITLPIPQIAAKTGAHISGTLDLHVNDVGIIAQGTQPQVCADAGVASLDTNQTVFCVVLVDLKGHKGDADCTDAISMFE